MAPLMQLASLLTRLQNSRVALQALDLLMELPSENQSESSCMDFGELQPSFTVENVSFAYPNSMSLALEDVSLRINPGDRIGIIGAMGSGKSTLAKLLTVSYTHLDVYKRQHVSSSTGKDGHIRGDREEGPLHPRKLQGRGS